MRFVLTAILVVLSISQTKASSTAQKPEAKEVTKTAEQSVPDHPSGNVSVGSLNKIEPPTQPNNGNSYDASKDTLYRLYLSATVIGVCGGFLGIVVLIWQTIVTRSSANAARDAAIAARENALAVTNAERAWIMVDIEPFQNWIVNLTHMNTELIGINVLCKCKNEGKSIAWITEKWAKVVTITEMIPPVPDFTDRERIFQRAVEPIAAGKNDGGGQRLFFDPPNTHAHRKAMLLYGYVKYRTIFGADGETRFGYIITPMDNLERLPAEYPEYNKNT